MLLNNNFNILPWYDSLEKQSSKKWYTFGQSWPLLCPKGQILPFQFICEELEILSNIFAVNVNTGASVDLGVRPTIQIGSQANATYYVVKMKATSIPALAVGTYYLRFNTSLGFLYSEEITVIDDVEKYIKIQYWNESTLNFASGEINFADDFKFELYINSTIGKPEYEFEEELTKRLGYKFIESQTSNKVYKFAFIAPEYICDAMRLIRLCDYIKITTKFDSYNALSFAYEPKWQDQGDLAAIDVEFDTDCIIQKLESFNRRLKESFYNALLADIDEPVLFSTDTVAQYYTEFTSISLINGKLIRQLDALGLAELKENKSSLYIPIDNVEDATQKAKKVSVADLLSLLDDINKLFKGHYDENGSLVWIEALSNLGVRGGVTMFVDGGQYDIPTIAAGLPFDGKTIWLNPETGVIEVIGGTGSGNIDSIHWNNIEDKPSFASVATSGKYSDLIDKPSFATVATSGKYSDLIDKPDLTKYATEKWVADKNYLDSTKLSEELAKYVTLDGDETINGVKDFANGLMIGGLPLIKMEDDVVYLDAHLVVRGGITMFGTGEDVDVPTIMDAIATDNVNLKVVDGVLTFIGQTGGGVADSVSWDNVVGKPSFSSVATSGKYSDLIGRPTLLSSFTDDVVSGKYLSLKGGRMDGDITLNDGAYIRTVNDNNYAILGTGGTSTLLVGAPIYHTSIRGEGVSIGSKTFIEGNGANILTLKRNNTSGGAFVSYKPMNQDDYGWLVGPNTDYDFTFHYYTDNAVTNILKAMVTPEGDIFTGGSLIIGSVNKADKLVALNVFGKGWFKNGVKLYAGNENVYNTDGITFSSSAGGGVIGRISSDKTGRIGVYPTYSFLVRPGYDGSNLVRGLSVDQRGITELICVDSALFNLHVRQNTNGFGAWVRYSSNNQYDKTWLGGVDSLYNFKLNYSSDNGNNYINELLLSNTGLLYTRKGFNTEASTDSMGGYQQDGITILRNNGATNGGVTLLSGVGGVYIRPAGSTVTTNQTVFPTTGGLRINDAPLATADKPSIALPFSSYISFGGFHALRGENNAVVLCAPVSESGTIVLRPNGNTSAKYQFSINNLGEAVLTSESAASLTINRTSATGGAYTRYNAANQTAYGWISGSSPKHTYQCQYYNGSGYYVKFELDSSGNGLFYGGVTMYSDIRKKTKLQDVELSLQQIADAPLIEHYYNSDSNKIIHVGSVAQYWASLNDWFCKLDNEGFYTMEIQNAALASAISIARELQKYESKTDKKIRLLKKRISELEDEIEKLKSA